MENKKLQKVSASANHKLPAVGDTNPSFVKNHFAGRSTQRPKNKGIAGGRQNPIAHRKAGMVTGSHHTNLIVLFSAAIYSVYNICFGK